MKRYNMLRTLTCYFNFAEAALDSTLLNDYEIRCSIFDEHAHRSIGLFFAVPTRLMVPKQQFHRAAQILAYAKTLPVPADDAAPHDDQASVRVIKIFGEDQVEPEEVEEPNNPWEILAIAYLFLVPGIGFLLERLPLMLFAGGRRGNRYLVLSPFDLHLIGAVLICIGLLLTVSYFYTRQAIALAEPQTSNINPQN
jgi:hypothetical protein